MQILIIIMAAMRVMTQIFTSLRLTQFLKRPEITSDRKDLPPISIIMPMKGVSENTSETLHALLSQDYPGKVELVIAVEDANDPVVALIEKTILNKNSPVEINLIKGVKRIGLNPKSSNVMHAIRAAKYDWLYFNDADSRPPTNHLSHLMCLIEADPGSFATALSVHHGGKDVFSITENISSNLEISTYYMLAGEETCPLNGGAYFLHKSMLEKMGGYEIALDTLTEDMMFSNLLKKVGAKCFKARTLVKTGGETQSFSGYMKRQVRWLLIAKCFKPHFFYLALLNMPTLWCFIVAIIFSNIFLFSLGFLLLVLRMLQSFYFQMALGTPSTDWNKVWAAVIYEMLLPVVWIKTLMTTEVSWGGNAMHVKKNGKLIAK